MLHGYFTGHVQTTQNSNEENHYSVEKELVLVEDDGAGNVEIVEPDAGDPPAGDGTGA